MLTKKQNLLETIRGGVPDRFVNQYEALEIILSDPYNESDPYPDYGQLNVVNAWGVTLSWPEGTPGPFPVHDEKHIVCNDITRWRECVKAPNIVFPGKQWENVINEAKAIDRNEYFVAPLVAPGIFERLHYLLSMEDALVAFYTEPEALKELIDYITDWELQYACELCKYLKPDAIFHHDDWGSQGSTFISPGMFKEFLLPAYKKIYGYYKSHGVELIIHHSDSYAATLVPYMIEMGVDIWQGAMGTNNIPDLIKKYGGQISFMSGIDSASVDFPGWTREDVAREVRKACTDCGKQYFIPCTTQGLAVSTFPGVYEAVSEEIDKASKEMF